MTDGGQLPNSPQRLLFLNRCYWPDSEATGQLLTDLCEDLAGSFDVHVVCGQPNAPKKEQYVGEGMQRRAGVTIHRLGHTQFAKQVPAGRLINLASFTWAASSYLRRSRIAFDIIISETDPFLLPIVAARHARRTDAQFVCYLQDIYPDVAEAIGKVNSGMVTERIRMQLLSAYQSAQRVVVLGNNMRRRLEAPPWSLESERIRVIPNWADCDAIRPLPLERNPFRFREGLQDAFVVMHSGNMGLTQRLDVLLEATGQPAWPPHAVLMLIGDGAVRPRLQSVAERLAEGRVRFLPYQPREQLSESLSAADLHVVSMHENISGCLCPSKLYGILAAGRPVLAIADETTELAQTVSEHQLGWRCQPGDPREIAEAIRQAASDPRARISAGQRARQLACRQFDRRVVTGKFTEMLDEIAGRTHRSWSSQSPFVS
jgi:glycosyltransferase involved in cell wall biosynthesis